MPPLDPQHDDAPGPPPAAGGRRGPGAVRVLLYSLLPLLVLLLLAEGALWALGLGDPDERLNLTRGFDEDASYILPDGAPGAWRTQMFDGETPEIRIPPKGARRRVLLFGGSNTELFPAEYLREQLELAAPDPGWEVINLGRRGYGSERVRILLHQAMVTQPDVVVIYSGHNEFVEGEFALELKEEWESPLAMDVAKGLANLRLMNVLSAAVKDARRRPIGDGHAPEARTQRLDSFAEIPFDQTLLYYEAYEQNLRSMCRAAKEAGAKVLLCTVVNNMLDVPSISHRRQDMTRDELIEEGQATTYALRLLPERMRLGLTNNPDPEGMPVIRLAWEDWRERNPGDQTGRTEPKLRELYGAAAGPPMWSPVRNWTPRTYLLMRTVEQLHRRELSDLERQQVDKAIEFAERTVALDPCNGLNLHMLALALYISGRDDARAVELFQVASLYDYAPNAANRIIHDAVRRVAASTPGIAFLDAQACFAERSPSGLVGYEFMMDNCHLHMGARELLMRDMVPEIVRLVRR